MVVLGLLMGIVVVDKDKDKDKDKNKNKGMVWVILYDSYLLFVGVLGCKIDINCVVYWL